MERDVQTEREMPRDISYYRERATQYNQVLFETSVVLNGGVPSKDVWSVADLPRMVERVVQRAEAAESRVKELEQTVVDMRDRVILERERREQAEAACAAMRKALESIADWNDDRSPEGIYRAIEIADQALSTTAGRDYVERLKKLELVAEAVREYRDYAWKPYNHRTFSQEVLGSLKKRVCDSLTALDGDGNG